MPAAEPDARKDREALGHWLEEMATAVRTIEREATQALHKDENQDAYRDLMRRKAQLLASLPDRARHLLPRFEEHERDAIADRLARFAASASNALRIDSVFYMSALLYPEDHTPGQPNDLETFAAGVRAGRIGQIGQIGQVR